MSAFMLTGKQRKMGGALERLFGEFQRKWVNFNSLFSCVHEFSVIDSGVIFFMLFV